MTPAQKRELTLLRNSLRRALHTLDTMAVDTEVYEVERDWRHVVGQLAKAFKIIDRIAGRKDMAHVLGTNSYPGQYRDGPGQMSAYLPGGREYTGALFGDAPMADTNG